MGIARQRRAISRRAGDGIEFGALRSTPLTVVAEDGLNLHVEVDEVEPADNGIKRRLAKALDEPQVTVVFAHGYCLNLDCWHFQRAAYRGLVRTVYYDQRSHGRSGRSSREHASIDQLGRDLRQVIDAVVPEGHVVLVGHSMGGMTIVALAEQFPDLFGDRVIGVGLISTTAGGLDPSRILLPMLPTRLTGRFTHRAVSTLRRGHRPVDLARRAGRAIATVATDRFAFGDEVPSSYVEFVDDMLSATPFEVVADFFPSFSNLDKFDHVEVLEPGADLDHLRHLRQAHLDRTLAQAARAHPGSRLLECDDAGHMVIMERHDRVNAELDQLITAAVDRLRTG